VVMQSGSQGGVMYPAKQTRELAAREGDGIQVTLLWHPGDNALTVSVEDARAGHGFRLAVAPDRALDAFYHPYACAA
jgi:alkanesulfonate monooxygenase SsuD/methylene tetrahydromethanopterin reductase-like flavin-dependent oxidoreductase (luciferase family)